MIIKEKRALAYTEKVTKVTPIENADRLEAVHINGWTCVCGKGEFKEGDLGVFFEIDSKLPDKKPFNDIEFLVSKHFKIKTQKIRGTISQGLFLPLSFFEGYIDIPKEIHEDLTETLGITYAVVEDNKRKSSIDKYSKMKQRHSDLFKKNKIVKWLYKRNWGKKLLFLFLGKRSDSLHGWPVGKFPGVSKTDQERVENMTWVLEDKTPFIVTQKCDGSSGTFILERKPFKKFEFYVCSRNVRMLKEDQECFYGSRNYYWEVAKKYDIENKMKDYLLSNPKLKFVCWQGEICAPEIQQNPHHLADTHLFLFHMTDDTGRYDIREAKKIWDKYEMESVPIINENYILPDDFDEFKQTADGYYEASVCEGSLDCPREGFVYYSTKDPSFSFKNVSRSYLLKH